MPEADRIAIVGMACLFPGAPDLAAYWHNISSGVDAITEVPETRWERSFYDPASSSVDRFYCHRGGFVDGHASLDPAALGVMPKAVEAAEPDQLLTLKIGAAALRDAGYGEGHPPPPRTGVIVGRGAYSSSGSLRLQQRVRFLPQLLRTLGDLFPGITAWQLAAVRERVGAELSYFGPDVASGVIPNLTVSRLAHRFNLRGPAYTVDAACASALLALEQACALLRQGRVDAMLVGGVHLCHDLTLWATFCQLGAMSRSGVIRPFSKYADGVLAGEGVGLVVLKRLQRAEADGDRIYAAVEGVGSSSDGRSRGLLAPAVEGQMQALENAWTPLPFARSALELLEAHGTATVAGDEAEMKTVAEFFGPHRPGETRPVIGTVKSMIGHAMPAAGIAGLIKAALAIYHGVLPPTLHCEEPHPNLAATRFRPLAQSEPWSTAPAGRIAAVNAFGFGGINAHAVLRGVAATHRAAVGSGTAAAAPPSLLRAAAPSPAGLEETLDRLARNPTGPAEAAPTRGRFRLAIVAPTSRRIALAQRALAAARPWRGRDHVYLTGEGMLARGGTIALLFPGLDASFAPRAGDLAEFFGRPLPRWCQALDPARHLQHVTAGLLGFNQYLFELLTSLGIHPHAMAGHSLGEWNALHASGMIAESMLEQPEITAALKPAVFPDTRFLVAACEAERVARSIAALDLDLTITHDNAPHQVIVCGPPAAIESLSGRLRAAEVLCQTLPFASGFHSPHFAPHVERARAAFERLPMAQPRIPVWSATTAAPFPGDEPGRRQLALSLLARPVRFRETIEAMYEAGHRVFLQAGTGPLPQMVDDILRGREHLALAVNRPDRTGLEQLSVVCAALWAEGAEIDFGWMKRGRPPSPRPQPLGRGPARPPAAVPLSLGVPLLRVQPLGETPPAPGLGPEIEPGKIDAADPVAATWRCPERSGHPLPASEARHQATNGSDPEKGGEPLQKLLLETWTEVDRASREMLEWVRSRRAAPSRVAQPSSSPASAAAPPRLDLRLSRYLDLETTIPYVRDHAPHPQREGWPVVADSHPLVPMAMELALVCEAIEEALPGWKVVEAREVQAYHWLAVAKPRTLSLRLRSQPDGRIAAELEGCFRALVTVAGAYPPPAAPELPPLRNPRPVPQDGASLYRDRWFFHGPAYQGVAAAGPIGDNGVDGDLIVPAGKGGLLDAMFQLSGFWTMHLPGNGLTVPIQIDRIGFHGPPPARGERFHDQIRYVAVDDRTCVSRHCLRDASGQVRIVLEGYRQRRLGLTGTVCVENRRIETGGYSKLLAPGVACFEDRFGAATAREFLARRYLAVREFAVYEALPPARRRSWLNTRIAAKDAVRDALRAGMRERGHAGIFPKEVWIQDDGSGRSQARSNVTAAVPEGLHLALAQAGPLTLAVASAHPAGAALEQQPLAAARAALAQALGGALPADAAGTVAARSPEPGPEPAREHSLADGLLLGRHWVATRTLAGVVAAWVSLDPATPDPPPPHGSAT